MLQRCGNRLQFFVSVLILVASNFLLIQPTSAQSSGDFIEVAPPGLTVNGGYKLEVLPQTDRDVQLYFARKWIRTGLIGWTYATTRYRVEHYPSSDASFKMTESICRGSAGWRATIDQAGAVEEWPDRGAIGRVGKTLSKALDPQKGFVNRPTYFRIVSVEVDTEQDETKGVKVPAILTCSTKPVLPITSNADVIQLQFNTVDQDSKTVVPSKVTIDGKSAKEFGFSTDTITTDKPISFSRVTKDNLSHKITFSPTDTTYEPRTSTLVFDQAHILTYPLVKKGSGKTPAAPTDDTSGNAPRGGQALDPGGIKDEGCFEKYLSFSVLGSKKEFSIGKYVVCQVHSLLASLVDFIARLFDNIPLNSWYYIRDTAGITTIWKISLGLVDFVVVGGLLVAAFANIFRFRIDTYGVKQILPGLIIGIILANLSFFILRLFIELSGILTQVIGNIISGYINNPIGDRGSASFIASQTWNELTRALFSLPSEWSEPYGISTGSVTEGLRSVGLITLDLTKTGINILALFMLLLFALIPLALFFLLMVVFYLRHYVVMALFMVSPIAFFSLGFPPLRAQIWQRWWGTFWKWVLMLPTSSLILGFALLFLYFMNGSSTGRVDVGRYFFMNVVAMILIFAAYKLPFSWGTMFGVNVLPKWGEAPGTGLKMASRGSRWAFNKSFENTLGRAGGGIAAFRARNNPPSDLTVGPRGTRGSAERKQFVQDISQLDREAKRLGVERIKGESMASLLGRVNQKRREQAISDARRKGRANVASFDPVRNIRGLQEGLKLRDENFERGELRASRSTVAFPRAAGREAAYRFYLTDNREKYQGYESLEQAVNEIGDIETKYGRKDKLTYLKQRIRQQGPGAVAADKTLGNIGSDDLANLWHLLQITERYARQRNTVARDPIGIFERSQRTGWQPGDPIDYQRFQTARSRPYGDDDELVEAVKTAVNTNKTNSAATAAAVAAAINLGGTPVDRTTDINNIISLVRKKVDAKSGGNLRYEDFQKAGLIGLTRDQFVQIRPALTGMIQNRKSLRDQVDSGGLLKGNPERVNQIGVSSQIAKSIVQSRPQDIQSLHQEINSYAAELNKGGAAPARLNEIRGSLENIHQNPGLKIAAGEGTQSLEAELKQSIKRYQEGAELAGHDIVQEAIKSGGDVNEALTHTIRNRQLIEPVSSTAADLVHEAGASSQQRLTPDEARSNPEIRSRIAPSIEMMVDFHPTLQQSMAQLPLDQQAAVIDRAAGQFAARVADIGKDLDLDATISAKIEESNLTGQLGKDLESYVQQEIQAAQTQPIQTQESSPAVTPTVATAESTPESQPPTSAPPSYTPEQTPPPDLP